MDIRARRVSSLMWRRPKWSLLVRVDPASQHIVGGLYRSPFALLWLGLAMERGDSNGSDAEGRRRSSRTRNEVSYAEAVDADRDADPERTTDPRNRRSTTGRTQQRDNDSHRVTMQPRFDNAENVDENDLCPICQLLLHKPVITRCGHTLCRSCMAAWADVSISIPTMAIIDIDDEVLDFDAATGLEAKCPMCRTLTSANEDHARAKELQRNYPRTYSEREAEESKDAKVGESIETVTVLVGNRHELISPPSDNSQNQHKWTFFVKPSRTDIIEELHIHLHPTFSRHHIVRARPPYAVQRIGWGVFTILADVILKAGYSWVSSDAVDSPDGAAKGMIRLEWLLDFSSFGATGAMGRCRLKVQSDRDWDDEEAARDQREWERVMRQYERDGRYEPD